MVESWIRMDFQPLRFDFQEDVWANIPGKSKQWVVFYSGALGMDSIPMISLV